ncbi:MAG TPA: hypothetical protein VG935_02270 [Patescibacteria group bacterium]|nr:hypothetical protein [Patescibacteria group bacterium]
MNRSWAKLMEVVERDEVRAVEALRQYFRSLFPRAGKGFAEKDKNTLLRNFARLELSSPVHLDNLLDLAKKLPKKTAAEDRASESR